MTRAPATKPIRRARRWVMLFVGDDFDFDEGAEVGRGLRGVEGDKALGV